MQAVSEISSEHEPEYFKIEAFIYFNEEETPKYDFRTKSLDTAIDLLVGIVNRPMHRNSSASILLTIGVLEWSCDATGAQKVEDRLEECLDIMNWKFV
jgi:hypothetical protein